MNIEENCEYISKVNPWYNTYTPKIKGKAPKPVRGPLGSDLGIVPITILENDDLLVEIYVCDLETKGMILHETRIYKNDPSDTEKHEWLGISDNTLVPHHLEKTFEGYYHKLNELGNSGIKFASKRLAKTMIADGKTNYAFKGGDGKLKPNNIKIRGFNLSDILSIMVISDYFISLEKDVFLTPPKVCPQGGIESRADYIHIMKGRFPEDTRIWPGGSRYKIVKKSVLSIGAFTFQSYEQKQSFSKEHQTLVEKYYFGLEVYFIAECDPDEGEKIDHQKMVFHIREAIRLGFKTFKEYATEYNKNRDKENQLKIYNFSNKTIKSTSRCAKNPSKTVSVPLRYREYKLAELDKERKYSKNIIHNHVELPQRSEHEQPTQDEP